MKNTSIYHPAPIRALWLEIAREWSRLYPGLFDEDDLRLAKNQPKNHFCEWYAAIHLFVRDGALCLVEKYAYASHPRKVAQLDRILPDERRRFLRDCRKPFNVQPPDLLAYHPERTGYRFVEVKGPNDRVRPGQPESWEHIENTLEVEVELIELRAVL